MPPPGANTGPAEQADPNFSRGEQHRMRDEANFPDTADERGKLVSGGTLKLLLVAIDSFGPVCWASYASIAERTRRWGKGISRRTVVSGEQALVKLGVLDRFEGLGPGRRVQIGHKIIWFPGVSTFCSDDLRREFGRRLFPIRNSRAAEPAEAPAPSALDDEPREPINAHECTGDADQCTGVHSKLQEASEGSASEAPSDVRRDEGEDGAKNSRTFFEDEVAAVRVKANELHEQVQPRTLADRQLVLKVATLWHDGELSEDMIRQVLESYQRKAEARETIRNRMAWFWVTLRGQCQQHHVRLEQLLARTAYPDELLVPRPEVTYAHL